MALFQKNDFSFPTRLIAFTVGVLVIVIAFFLTGKYVYGSVTITSDTPQARVVLADKSDPLPHTYRLKPGRYTVRIEAEGYVSVEGEVSVRAFLTRHEKISLKKKVDTTKLPLVNDLPYFATGEFEIPLPNPDGTYTINLLPNRNWFDSNQDYNGALKEAKKKALEWVTSHKVDPVSLSILWDPYDPGE